MLKSPFAPWLSGWFVIRFPGEPSKKNKIMKVQSFASPLGTLAWNLKFLKKKIEVFFEEKKRKLFWFWGSFLKKKKKCFLIEKFKIFVEKWNHFINTLYRKKKLDEKQSILEILKRKYFRLCCSQVIPIFLFFSLLLNPSFVFKNCFICPHLLWTHNSSLEVAVQSLNFKKKKINVFYVNMNYKFHFLAHDGSEKWPGPD